jgi:hypothetical protein
MESQSERRSPNSAPLPQETQRDSERPIYRIVLTDDEIMVHAPNGSVRFMGWWATLGLCWRLLRKHRGEVHFDVSESRS